MIEPQDFELSTDESMAGFRLQRLEVFNWGTFDKRVWVLDLAGSNGLLTGDIGSGKSTLVDAVTTLLVPSQRVAYNKAAGGEARERTLRSYVLGYYKSERADVGSSSKPVALRDHNNYSVILGVFHNSGFGKTVTLAQVFYMKESKGQPTRFYVAAEQDLSITADFSGFGTEITGLRKKLRDSGAKLFESFPPYGAWFRRRFGIENEQALDLFHQTVSLKSVGNLTGFVRTHMLEPFDVATRIEALIGHFEDLNKAHEAVLKAKDQVGMLQPLVADCASFEELLVSAERLRGCRDALRPWFGGIKSELVEQRIGRLQEDVKRYSVRIEKLAESQQLFLSEERELRRNIAENGGDRIDRIEEAIRNCEQEQARRQNKYGRYAELMKKLSLFPAENPGAFLILSQKCDAMQEKAAESEAAIQNELNETGVQFAIKQEEHKGLQDEIFDLQARRSNIDSRQVAIRRALCTDLGLREDEMPFAGELIRVRDEERDWEGAVERLLHNFGLSLLVPDKLYSKVADWVDSNNLKGRLVYFRVREKRSVDLPDLHVDSLVRKIAIKPDSQFYNWLESEVVRRFDVACCATQEQFRREKRAITRAGQIKASGERHEKDDRYRIDDRSRFVLGWSNEAKIAVLKEKLTLLAKQLGDTGAILSGLQSHQAEVKKQIQTLLQLGEYRDFNEIDWEQQAVKIGRLEDERRQLEAASDILKLLTAKLQDVEMKRSGVDSQLVKIRDDRSRTEQRKSDAESQLQEIGLLVAAASPAQVELYPALLNLRPEAIGDQQLTVESCDNREREMRDWLQSRIDSGDKKCARLRDRIIDGMRTYTLKYELETQEVDVAVESADEYRQMLVQLQADDLPRFEERFKELLNENTIREVANFQSQLAREQETIKEKIGRINESLTRIDYNPGRYIVLEAEPSIDADIRDFRNELRGCTEGTLTGSDDAQYSEAKFLQVRRIIERFRGREGQSEADRRWTAKVTDVRNWFSFAASERWREDDVEFEHYADSGGKSGGQKEKLAYTVLAASLAYQFGLEWGEVRSRSFRFVVIDEAFGRGSDESAQYGLRLFAELNLQLLIVTPLQKIHIIEPYVSAVGFVHNNDGRESVLRNLSIEQYREEREAYSS
jgi:uncharacterized protein YPO0396